MNSINNIQMLPDNSAPMNMVYRPTMINQEFMEVKGISQTRTTIVAVMKEFGIRDDHLGI